MPIKKIFVAQLGARMHYAVPKIFLQNNMLSAFVTDLYLDGNIFQGLLKSPIISSISAIKRASGRYSAELKSIKVRSNNLFGIQRYFYHFLANSLDDKLKAHIRDGKKFSSIIKRLLNDLKSSNYFYTFNGEGMEAMHLAKDMGLYLILEQTIASMRVQKDLLTREMLDHPRWILGSKDTYNSSVVTDFIQREEEEWGMADLIIGGSDFVKHSLEIDKIFEKKKLNFKTVPYGVEIAPANPIRQSINNRNFRIAVVGQLGLRKGTPYVLEAAALLGGRFSFRLIGSTPLHFEKNIKIPNNVELTGHQPRHFVRNHLLWADLFLLPSICEGSATAIYEAISLGLPVITTMNSGSPIRDGIEGRIIPIRSTSAIVEAIHFFCNQDLISHFSEAAFKRSYEFSISAYGKRLIEAVGNL